MLSIWEGTTNVLSLDVLRSLTKSQGQVMAVFFSTVQVSPRQGTNKHSLTLWQSWCWCSWLGLLENTTKLKASDKHCEGVSPICFLNSTYKSRARAVFILGSSCAAKNADNFISTVRSFALSVLFKKGTNVSIFLM